MTETVDLAVVGAGPAGLSAALEGKAAGLSVVVLDENERPGGQIFRQLPRAFTANNPAKLGHDHRRGRDLLDRAATAGLRIESGTVVWNAAPGRLSCCRDGASFDLACGALVLATGAYDRPVPVPGWTLPGVLTSGGAQTLLKSQRLLAGRRILLSGTGPLNLVLANQLAAAGATVVAVLELVRPTLPELVRLAAGPWEYVSDGLGYLAGLARRRIPLMTGWTLLEARGRDGVEEAVIGRVDRDWRNLPGSERILAVDTIGLGYGLVPSTELSRLIGCEHRYAAELGGWVPVRDAYQETSLPGVFGAGDGAGVAGSLVAVEEGRLAGLRAARRLNRLSEGDFQRRAAPIAARLARLNRYRAVLDGLSRPRPGLFERVAPDTTVCRCEEVSAKEIDAALAEGARTLRELKPGLRAGMGVCQGRICGPTLVELVARQTGADPASVHPFSPRPPVRPIPLSALIGPEPAE